MTSRIRFWQTQSSVQVLRHLKRRSSSLEIIPASTISTRAELARFLASTMQRSLRSLSEHYLPSVCLSSCNGRSSVCSQLSCISVTSKSPAVETRCCQTQMKRLSQQRAFSASIRATLESGSSESKSLPAPKRSLPIWTRLRHTLSRTLSRNMSMQTSSTG